MNLKPRLTKKWIEALRSGQYVQGQGSLRYYDKYCCLGVLCNIYYGHDKWQSTMIDVPGLYCIEGKTCHLPNEVRKKIVADDGTETLNFFSTLMTMNDETGSSFTEIADYIETTLKKEKA